MRLLSSFLLPFFLLSLTLEARAENGDATQSVWVNEAIVATYTFNYQNFLERQQEIAKYFTSKSWVAYSQALLNSKLEESVKKNKYRVSAVALSPPTIKAASQGQWMATMPLLVSYRNPQYQQKQVLEIQVQFAHAPSGQGVRGLAITSFQSKVIKPACKCPPYDALPEEKNKNPNQAKPDSK